VSVEQLDVDYGDFVVLLGPNCAGKTTMLMLLTGLLHPDAGDIVVMGHNIRCDEASALRHIRVVFQQPSIDLDLSVTRNLMFHALLHGLPRRTARTEISLRIQQFGLLERADNPVRALSGGNRRRLELARALLHRPKLLIFDEATSGLDHETRMSLLGATRALARAEQVGVIWATHLLDEVDEAARIVVLINGRVRFDGFARSLLNAPESDLVGAYAQLLQRG